MTQPSSILRSSAIVAGLAGMLAMALASCNVTKHLKEGEYLVEENVIVDKGKALDKTELENFIRQKPNSKLFGVFPKGLWLYNQVDQDKMVRKKALRDARYETINEERMAKNKIENEARAKKGKKPKTVKLKDKDKPTFRESILDAGEAPVIYDSTVADMTVRQMQRFVESKGYFNGRVWDSVVIDKKRKRAKIYYFISKSEPYIVQQINYKIEDPQVEFFVMGDTVNSKLKLGMRYDADVFQAERTRISDNLRNHGYYAFAPEYVYYRADTTLPGRVVNLYVGIRQFDLEVDDKHDSVVYINHPRYHIGNVYMVTEKINGALRNASFKDTVFYNNILFLYNQKPRFRRKDLANHISIEPGQVFQQRRAEDTYRRLTDLHVFKSVLLQFNKSPKNDRELDCMIYCQPEVKQSNTIEGEGTNTSGNLGIAGSFVYQNRNIFRGAELLEFKIKGSITAQRQLNNNVGTGVSNVVNTFNTWQIGPELNLYFPKQLFPFTVFKFKRDAAPRTYVNASFNFQSRPGEFDRTISNVSYGFQFRSHKSLARYNVVPLEVSLVKATLTPSFQQQLYDYNDYFLLNSFIDHLTILSKVSITLNNNVIKGIRNYSYFKVDLSSAGNLLRALYQMTDQPKDTAGRYHLFGQPFAQFLKVNMDYRYYYKVRGKSSVVYRIAGGIGKPLKNLSVLPYEQSFFSGGPNSVRAWRARTLGPGAYNPGVDNRFDKIGDILIEANIEYRFHIFRSFYGAWFLDGGNVWLLKDDPNKPGGKFDVNSFYKEIAMGSGLGIRWDFQLFVLRLDGAFKVYDPKYAEGDRWTFNKKPLNGAILNFGIGYPF